MATYQTNAQKETVARVMRMKVRDGQGVTRQDRAERARDRQKTRAKLYAEAWRRGIPGRSKMTKRELQHALG
jgi:hypothetical protein